MDVASWGAAIAAATVIGPQRPRRAPGSRGGDHAPGLRSIAQGFGYLRGRQVLQGAYLIDINATVFGMPKAVFPALAATIFGGGASTLGFLYAATGAGALLGAVTTGWVHRVRRQGRAVVLAVIVWGAAIACFGLVRSLPVALALLALAGWADVLSAIFRSTIIQLAAPDDLRGRLIGVQMAAVIAGPRMGDVEAGAVANALGATMSVVSGGLACIVGAMALARLLPAFYRQEAPGPQDAAGLAAARPA
jgi:predicted MFS family arabinose efflux permease